MKKTFVFAWIGMFVLCAILGFIQTTSPILKIALTLICLIFFLPGALLLYNAITEKDEKTIRIIRWISLGSLILTTIALLVNIVCGVMYAAAAAPAQAVTTSYSFLVIVSSPMYCGKFKALSLFLWAALFISTFMKRSADHKK